MGEIINLRRARKERDQATSDERRRKKIARPWTRKDRARVDRGEGAGSSANVSTRIELGAPDGDDVA